MGEPLDARTAAERLGVDVRTLYAYVSRGALRRVPGPDGRSSRYDSDELELLARRSRPRTLPRPAASIDLVIATRVSTVTDGLVSYRGTDLLDLVAAGEPFEAVAELLWAGRPAPGGQGRAGRPVAADAPTAPLGWELPVGPAASAGLVLRALGGDVPIVQRFAAVASTASHDNEAANGPPSSPDWPAWGRTLISALIEASGPALAAAGPSAPASAATDRSGPVAWRVWQRWSPLRPARARVRALNTALVLLAEHELAPSTLAVRVAASARATPAGCLLAGLGTLSGALHGDVPALVWERLFGRQAGDPQHPLPGFGHSVHRHGDPRTAPLLRAVYAIATPADRDLIMQASRGAPDPPNLDFALGALCYVARMPPQAATAIFAVARTAGWIAHAAEEYAEPPVRFRGRALIPDRPGRRPVRR
jgi:citrate synthase